MALLISVADAIIICDYMKISSCLQLTLRIFEIEREIKMNRLLGLFLFFVAAFSIALLLGAAYPGVTFIEALIGVLAKP